MPNLKLNSTTIKGLHPKDKRVIYWQSDRSGLGVEVKPNGIKTFVFQSRQDGTPRRMVIGRVGDWTFEEAKEWVALKRAKIYGGDKPAEERKADLMTLDDLFDAWIASRSDQDWKPATRNQYNGKYRNQLKPTLGKKTPWKIQLKDVTAIRKSMQASGQARTFNLALAVFKQLMRWGWKQGYFPRNYEERDLPIHNDDIKPLPVVDRDKVMSPAEMVRLMAAIDELSGKVGGISVHAAAALKILIFTGARHAEIVRARWDQLERDAASGDPCYILRIDDHKTSRHRRTGKNVVKLITLSGPCVAVVDGLPRVNGNPHLFVGQKPGKSIKWLSWPWEVVCKHAGFVAGRKGFTIHDLRHAFVTYGIEAGASIEAMGAAVGHSSAYMTERYVKRREEAQKAAARIGVNAIADLLNKEADANRGNVVPFVDRRAS